MFTPCHKWLVSKGLLWGGNMTDEQLDVARTHQDHHRDAYGYAKPNVEFHKESIERLEDLPLDLTSFDVVVSNCVANLATDKQEVLRPAFNLLKPGG